MELSKLDKRRAENVARDIVTVRTGRAPYTDGALARLRAYYQYLDPAVIRMAEKIAAGMLK